MRTLYRSVAGLENWRCSHNSLTTFQSGFDMEVAGLNLNTIEHFFQWFIDHRMRFEIQTKAVDVCFVTTDEQSGKSCFVHSLLPIESSVSSLVFKGEKPNRERKCAVKFKLSSSILFSIQIKYIINIQPKSILKNH